MGANMNRTRHLAQISARVPVQQLRYRGARRGALSCCPPPRRRHLPPTTRLRRRTRFASAVTAPPAWRRSWRTATPCNCMCRPNRSLKSVHGANGCTSCHSDVDPGQASAREKRHHERAQLCGRTRPRSARPAMPTSSSNGRAASTPRWCAAAIRRRRSAPTVIIRMRSSRARRPRSTRSPARSATRISTPPISAACTRNPGSVPKTAMRRSAPAATARMR